MGKEESFQSFKVKKMKMKMLLLPTYVAGNVSGIGKLSIINGKSFLKKMFDFYSIKIK